MVNKDVYIVHQLNIEANEQGIFYRRLSVTRGILVAKKKKQ